MFQNISNPNFNTLVFDWFNPLSLHTPELNNLTLYFFKNWNILVQLGNDYHGRVLIGGQTICSQGWDEGDATVVCNMLGYQSGAAVEYINEFNTGYVMSDVNCSGHETNIAYCDHVSGDITCPTFMDAGVHCSANDEDEDYNVIDVATLPQNFVG